MRARRRKAPRKRLGVHPHPNLPPSSGRTMNGRPFDKLRANESDRLRANDRSGIGK